MSWLVSLRGRLLLLIGLATLPALLFTFFAADNERAATLARTEADALHLARLASREHVHQIEGARRLVRWLGDALAREGRRSPILRDPDFLPALLAGHPQLANIGVLSAEGQVLASAYPLSSYRSWKDHPAFVAALRSDDVAAGTYLISPIFARPTLNHAYAVRDAARRVTAVVFAGLDLGWLAELARQVELPAAFSLLIADREGHVLASAGSPLPEGSSGRRLPDLAALAQAGRGGLLEILGMPRYFVAAPLGDAPDLYVAVSLPYAQVRRRANAAFYRTLAGLGLLTAFTIAAVFLATELAVLRALRSLVRAVRRFGAGDLAARAIAPRGYHELASLAAAFNAMADSLAARQREAAVVQAQLRALASRLQVARVTEATRISRELHDEIGQLLTSLKIDLSRLQEHCPEKDRACAAALRDGMMAMIRQLDAAVGVVRRLSSELRPNVLDRLGLIAALEWQARDLEARSGLVIQVEAAEPDPPAPWLVAVTLFRIAQEALTNVVRHAEATQVEIRLATTAEGLELTVHDDGKGIAPHAVEDQSALGIVGMRERARLINGRFTIRGAPGRGTTVSVVVPRPWETEVPSAPSAG